MVDPPAPATGTPNTSTILDAVTESANMLDTPINSIVGGVFGVGGNDHTLSTLSVCNILSKKVILMGRKLVNRSADLTAFYEHYQKHK